MSLLHPDDPGVMSPLLLNCVRLEPGEALFLEAGEPHAYLRGVGVEIMGISDNVLRGGVARKHVDVPELVRVLTFASGEPDVLKPQAWREGEGGYETPAEEFALSVIRVDPPCRAPVDDRPERFDDERRGGRGRSSRCSQRWTPRAIT